MSLFMKRISIRELTLVLAVISLIVGIAASPSLAQEKLPVPHTNPNEMISLSKDMTFSQAIDILNTYANKYDHKFIMNRTAVKGTIGVTLPLMYWYDALKYLGEINNFQIVSHEKYYELDPVTAKETEKTVSQNSSAGDNGTNKVSTKTREVRISATFFEGNRDALWELGIDWSTFKNGVVQVNSNSAADVANNKQFSINLSPFEIGKTGINVQALFQAFASNDLGHIISQPTIEVIDGHEGHIQVGQTFFINQKDFSGNTVSKSCNVGTILTVTPQVITQNDTTFIDLQVHGERSSLQPNSAQPIVNDQTSNSDIMLLSGESTAIAGLYETTTSTSRKGIPFLKDLPPWFFGLRYLFGYNSKTYTQQELIIIIKASLVPDIKQRMAQTHKTVKQLLEEQRNAMQQQNKEVGSGVMKKN